MSEGVVIVSCPFPDPDTARQAARTVVEEGLAACAQRFAVPIHSVYRWRGELCEEEEILLLLKTAERIWPRLQERLQELHPYELPEILATPAEGNQAYLDWVVSSCRGPVSGD